MADQEETTLTAQADTALNSHGLTKDNPASLTEQTQDNVCVSERPRSGLQRVTLDTELQEDAQNGAN